MLRNLFFLSIVILSVYAFSASTNSTGMGKGKQQTGIDTIYDFPEDVTTDTGRTSFVKNFYAGRIIYKETCAKCHDSTKNDQLFYPDFSLPQLLDYEMRFQYPEHQDDLRDEKITAEELDKVVLFLQYKKHNLLAVEN